MSYQSAKYAFGENQQLLGSAQRDPLAWNLSVGLIRLADALEDDARQTRYLLEQILEAVQRPR